MSAAKVLSDPNRSVDEVRRTPPSSMLKTPESPELIGTTCGSEEFVPTKIRRLRKMNYREYLIYQKKVEDSDGFDVSGCTGRLPRGGIIEIRGTGRLLEKAEDAAKFAVDKYNMRKRTKLELVELVKANAQGLGGIRFYLTLKVIDRKHNQPRIYRSKVYVDYTSNYNVGGIKTLESFKPPPPTREEILAYKSKLRGARHLGPQPQKETPPGNIPFVKKTASSSISAESEVETEV